MIYELSKNVRDYLAARKYPVRVIYGPERVKRSAGHGHAIVIERPLDTDDQLAAPKGAQGNPHKPFDISLAARATIYARSVLPAAGQGDHERECEKVRDALLAALYKYGAAGRTGGIAITGARYINPPGEVDPKEIWNGVCYELRFTVPRGVYDREYVGEQNAGNARPTGTPTGVTNRSDVSAPGTSTATGCDST